VQVAGGNDVTDAEALRRAQQMREHGLIMDPRHPLAQTGFGRSTYEDPTGATQALGEAYLRAYGELAAGAAAGPLVRGAPTAGRAALEAGQALARNPTVYVNATDFSFNLARGYQLGRNLNVFSGPLASSPGAWLGHGVGVAYGVSSRLSGIVTGWFGP
jgi:hypothetical protein